jgi:transposase
MYSPDFRKLALRILKEKGSYRKAARVCKISISTLHRWATMGTARHTRTGRPKKLGAQAADLLRQYLQDHPVTTLREMSAILSSQGYSCRNHAIRSALRIIRVSRKRTTMRHSKGDSSAPAIARVKTFKEKLATMFHRNATIISLDESYFSEKTLPLYGYSPVGQPCVVRSPTTSWKQRSLLLAIANDGSKVPCIVKGPIDGEKFREFIKQLPYPPGSIILMDNASIHKGASEKVIKDKGYIALYTPPYSPEYNPVENVFSIIKCRFRAAWPWVSGVDTCILETTRQISPEAIRSVFAHLASVVQHMT